MSEAIAPTSKAPQQTGNVPEFKRQEKLQPDSGTPNYGQAFTSLAFTPTALGDLGATMAQSASFALAKSRGQSLGQNPEGELLPAITDADKVFNEAYSAQASATLSLQAQDMMQKGQEELSQAYELSPGMVGSFTKNMTEGMQGILDHAPSEVRGALSNNFTQQIMSYSHRANMTMIGQQKERTKSQSTVYTSHLTEQMHDAALSGNNALAKEKYDTIRQTTSANLNSGMWSPEQADAIDHQAKISYYSSGEIAQALVARKEHNLEGFLSSMIDTKPPEVSWPEWEKVRNQVVGYIGAVENFDNRDQSLMVSQANTLASKGPLSPEVVANLREKLQPARFNNFMSTYASGLKGKYATNQRVANIQSSWSNPSVMNGARKDDLNAAFYSQTEAAKVMARQKGIDLSDDEAQLETASTAAGPIPAYIHKLNTGLQSGNPALMSQAWQDYNALVKNNGKAAQGVSKKSIAMGTMMNNFLEQGMSPDLAAQKANETIMDKSSEARENTAQLIKDWKTSAVKDSTHRDAWARNMAGISSGTEVQNGAGFGLHLQHIMESNLALTNGDVTTSETMLKDALKQNWGYTSVNGEREFTFMPIEKAIGLEEGANPLIKSDMLHQLGQQLVPTKKAYDEGRLSYYYRINEPVSFDDYIAAKTTVESKRTLKEFGKALFSGIPPTVELKKEFATIAQYEAGDPAEIEMVQRGANFKPRPPVDEDGNIDIYNRPKVDLGDGKIATVDSMSFNEENKEILVPRVTEDGKHLSDAEAIKHYHKTGQFLGKFSSVEKATAYAEWLHNQQDEHILGNAKGEIEKFKLNVNPSPLIQQSSGDNPVIGDYDFTLSNEKGKNLQITGAFSGQQSHPVYRPDVDWIKNNYFVVNGIDPTSGTEKDKVLARAKFREEGERALNPTYQRLRRGVF